MSYSDNSTIKSWAEEDRPREKMLLKGRQNLTDAELLAILIGSGSTENSAVSLSKIIMAACNNNLNELAKLSIKDLIQFKGIGEAKAITISAAMEIGRRRTESDPLKKLKIGSSNDAYKHLKQYLLDLDHEQFYMIMLNRNSEHIKTVQISSGGVSGTVADPKMIFKIALENLSTMIVLSHNHPSGNLKPSESDIELTAKIKEGAKLLDITLIDHLIFTNNGYYSWSDDNAL
jgi:DNA repair protein RadC